MKPIVYVLQYALCTGHYNSKYATIQNTIDDDDSNNMTDHGRPRQHCSGVTSVTLSIRFHFALFNVFL